MDKDILYPLRRLHGWLHDHWITWQSLCIPFGKKAYIVGTPTHTNLGDSAIVLAETAFLQQYGFAPNRIKELTMSDYDALKKYIKTVSAKNAFIFWPGGGNLGNQWMKEELFRRQVMREFPRNPILIFPQTIYYTPDAFGEAEQLKSIRVYNNRKSLLMVARERQSYEIMSSLYPDTNTVLVPDIVLSADMDVFGVSPRKREYILMCMRSDEERSMTDALRTSIDTRISKVELPVIYTDMHSDCAITKINRADCVKKKMEEFCGARLVITDRLHGMVFAAVTGTPCIVFSNYNHKVRGTYEWIKHLPYIRFAESVSDVQHNLPELLLMQDCKYDNTPLMPYFEKLAEVVRNYAHN